MFHIFYQACTFYAPEDILTRIVYVGFREMTQRANQTEKENYRSRHIEDNLAWKIISKEGVGLVFQTAFLFARSNHWNFIPHSVYFFAITILRCENGRVSQTFNDVSVFLSLSLAIERAWSGHDVASSKKAKKENVRKTMAAANKKSDTIDHDERCTKGFIALRWLSQTQVRLRLIWMRG